MRGRPGPVAPGATGR